MTERHEKWTRVEPGHVIPAGQPHAKARTALPGGARWFEYQPSHEDLLVPDDECAWFVDSSWRPPLELPTEPTWGIPMQGGCEQNVGQWMVQGSVFEDLSGTRLSASSVTDFIPLTDEQIKRIEGFTR